MLQRNTSSHLYEFTDLKSLNERGPLVISYGKGIYVYDTKGCLLYTSDAADE